MQTVYFPNLGWSFDLNPVAFTIGNLTFRWYGVLIAIGFLLALLYVFKRVKEFGLDADRVIDVILAGTIGSIIGARLYYVIFQWSEFKGDPVSIFKIWNGGLAIYGGLIGAFLVGGLFCKVRKVKLLPMLDLACSGIFIGQCIGRWGNFVNVEAFGGNTTLPWGMTSAYIKSYLAEHEAALEAIGMNIDPSLPVHPTFLYESIWCLIGFILIAIYIKHRRFDGEILLMYTGWYGFGRMFIEGLRTDSLMLGNLRVSQVLAGLLFAASLIIWLIVRGKIRANNDPEYLKLYALTDEGKEVVAGTYYKRLAEEKKAAKEAAENAEDASGAEEAEDADDGEDKALTDAKDAAEETAEKAENAVEAAADEIKEGAEAAKEDLAEAKEKADAAAEEIAGEIKEGAEAAKEDLAEAKEKADSFAEEAAGKMAEGFAEAKEEVADKLDEMKEGAEAAKEDLAEKKEKADSFMEEAAGKFAEGLSEAKDETVEKLGEIREKAAEKLDDLKDRLTGGKED